MYRACIASTAGHACVQLSASTHRPCVQLSVLIVHACNCLSSSCVRATVSTDVHVRNCRAATAATHLPKHMYHTQLLIFQSTHTHTHTQLLIFQSTPPTLGRPVSRAREDTSLLGSLVCVSCLRAKILLSSVLFTLLALLSACVPADCCSCAHMCTYACLCICAYIIFLFLCAHVYLHMPMCVHKTRREFREYRR
jgi:hypothetical protein